MSAAEPTRALEQRTIVHPATGEVLDLALPTDQLVVAFDLSRDLEARCAAFRAHIGDEVIDRMDHERVWTVHIAASDGHAGYKATAPSPQPPAEYDAALLHERLSALVDAGELSARAMLEAVEQVTEYKAKPRGINALKKGGGRVADVIEACRLPPSDRRRRLSVTPTLKTGERA